MNVAARYIAGYNRAIAKWWLGAPEYHRIDPQLDLAGGGIRSRHVAARPARLCPSRILEVTRHTSRTHAAPIARPAAGVPGVVNSRRCHRHLRCRLGVARITEGLSRRLLGMKPAPYLGWYTSKVAAQYA